MEIADVKRRMVTFKSENGTESQTLDLPISVASNTLVKVLNTLLEKDRDEYTPYRLFLNEKELTSTLESSLSDEELKDDETVLEILYVEEAPFKVRPITRCTSSLSGHAESVTCVAFSPGSHILATGSGDTTVRLWDLDTQTPLHVATGHKHWVLCVAWAPDATRVASADKTGMIGLWNGETGEQLGRFLTGHTKFVTGLAWEPYHSNPECRLLASSSKDGSIKIWDTLAFTCLRSLTSHTSSVTFVRWGGAGLIYSASQDRTIKVWRAADGVLCRTLEGHAHWVNVLAVNCDWVLKNGPYGPGHNALDPRKANVGQLKAAAAERVAKASAGGERLASGSDDLTLYLWAPETSAKPIDRLTGHQQPVNDCKFSPDGRTLASASYDKTIRLWDGITGKFICTLRGHVQRVYVIAWAPDSRLLLSGSADSTLKVWDCRKHGLAEELPGHADDVYAVDWSADGSRVGSGGKDKAVRLWQA